MVLVAIVAFVAAYLVAEDIFEFLVRPLTDILRDEGYEPKLIYTHLLEAFFTKLKVAFWTAFFVSFPLFATQVYKFAAPGLSGSPCCALAKIMHDNINGRWLRRTLYMLTLPGRSRFKDTTRWSILHRVTVTLPSIYHPQISHLYSA